MFYIDADVLNFCGLVYTILNSAIDMTSFFQIFDDFYYSVDIIGKE